MKKVASILLFSFLTFFSSCLKEDHTVRLKNNYTEQIDNITVGKTQLGSVAPGATSAYKSINTGDFSISGTTPSGKYLKGSGTIKGKGKHKWTITVSASGTASMKED